MLGAQLKYSLSPGSVIFVGIADRQHEHLFMQGQASSRLYPLKDLGGVLGLDRDRKQDDQRRQSRGFRYATDNE